MSQVEFASATYTAGQLNAIIKLLRKQGGEDGPERFLRGEITVCQPARCWREEDGVIYFTVTSDGTTGPQWVDWFQGKKFNVSPYAKSVLLSSDFKPTSGVTYEIAVFKGMLFTDEERITKNIRAKAAAPGRKWLTPNAEVACLIRKMFTDDELEAMGLWWIVVMHDPIKDSGGYPDLLGAGRDDRGRCLGAFDGEPGSGWLRGSGFAFPVSQTVLGT